MREHFHLFAYGSLRSGGAAMDMMRECELIGSAHVGGVLYDIDGNYRALVLYGSARIEGDVWRCPNALLHNLDEYEGVRDGLFRRIGAEVELDDGSTKLACWVYVAGPALSRKLVPARRI